MTKPLCFFLLLLIFFPANSLASELKISIMADQGTIDSYTALVKTKGGDPFAITDYKSSHSSRPAISLLLMVQALKLGGLDFHVNFILSPNPGRGVNIVKKGHALLYGEDIWDSQFDETVYKSEPIFTSGQFQKGFFVGENSRFLKKQPSKHNLFNAPLILEATWYKDIASLTKRGFKNIKTTSQYQSMISMVATGRAQVTFLEFPDNDQMVHHSEHGLLYSIPGVKVCFSESRHFMVSQKHPLGEQAFAALQKGLKILREQKTITRAYTESGVFNSKVATWIPL